MMHKAILWILGLIVNSMVASGCLKSKEDQPPPIQNPGDLPQAYNWPKIGDSAFNALNTYFWQAGEGYFIQNNQGNLTFHYWWNAHALDALADVYIRTSDNVVATQMGALHAGIKKKNNGSYINDYYDDMEWLALACLRSHAATSDQKYLETAQLLWNDIKQGWNADMGGGIAWRKTQTSYKNTPANAPAVILAARMYAITKNADDLEWAKKIYTWLITNLVDNATGLVWDGINRENDGKIDKDWKFTYNQGIFIGAALELYKATSESGYLDAALRTANNSITDPQLAPGGILKNENQGDGGLFKGILVRYLTELALSGSLSDNDRNKFVNFLKKNAESLWSKGTSKPLSLFSSNWTSLPSGAVDMSTQLSGIFLMEAMTRLKKEGLVE